MGQQKIYLTSRGLNTKLGRRIIGKALFDRDKSGKILMITIGEYNINTILRDAAIDLGFLRENIVIYDGKNIKKLVRILIIFMSVKEILSNCWI